MGSSYSTHSYRPGYAVTSLPHGHRSETIGGTRYYSYDGVYYRPRGSSYVVVERPSRSRWSDQRRDHDRDGVPDRYDRRPHRSDSSLVIRALPHNHRVVTHRGQRYYRVGDTYYRQNTQGYVRVRSPF